MTPASTAPVPDAERATTSFVVSNTCWVFDITSVYRSTKSSLRWFIMGASMALMTLLGTFVGPGSIARYSMFALDAVLLYL